MKKSLLTLTIIGAAAAAFGQGAIIFQNSGQPDYAGFNTVTSSSSDSVLSDFASGNVTVELFSQTSANVTAGTINTINSEAGSAATEAQAIAAINADFVQQNFGLSAGSETASNSFAISEGDFTGAGVGGSGWVVGTGGTLVTGSTGYYALIAIDGSLEGALVLNANAPYGLGGGQNPSANMNLAWPNQNLLLTTVGASPEPTTLALAGLGGLSMLLFRRRKSQ